MQAPCPGEGWGAYVTQARAAAEQTNLHPKPETPCYNRLTEPYKPALCSQKLVSTQHSVFPENS